MPYFYLAWWSKIEESHVTFLLTSTFSDLELCRMRRCLIVKCADIYLLLLLKILEWK